MDEFLDLIPGPTKPCDGLLQEYAVWRGSSDTERQYAVQRARVESRLAAYLGCARNDEQNDSKRTSVVLMSGEGMLALWSALKSTIVTGQSEVLVVDHGLFGDGLASMARQCGAARVYTLEMSWQCAPTAETVCDVVRLLGEHADIDLVVAVHCETPSGTLNAHLGDIGKAARDADALFLVDFVSSSFGTDVQVDAWHIDVGMSASQKVLGSLPDTSILTVSERAWRRIECVGYAGYDALAPWRKCCSAATAAPSSGDDERIVYPYTQNWSAVAALERALTALDAEGKQSVFERHERVAARCRQRLVDECGLQLYAEHSFSPTVTAVHVPVDRITFDELARRLCDQHRIRIAGNYGPLANKVFRIGHMGTQATDKHIDALINALKSVLSSCTLASRSSE
jgi:aspartate aminotransferase-like enzyme